MKDFMRKDMKIEPYKSLIINEKLEASSIAEYHKTILESIMYYQNRKKRI